MPEAASNVNTTLAEFIGCLSNSLVVCQIHCTKEVAVTSSEGLLVMSIFDIHHSVKNCTQISTGDKFQAIFSSCILHK